MLQDTSAVIFDMDGTLIDSMWVWKKVDTDFLQKRNIKVPNDIQKQIEGLSFTGTARYFKQKFLLTEDIEEIKNEWTMMVKHYYEHIIPLKAGVFEFISGLSNKGIKIGLATSNSRDLTEAVLKRTGIYEFFSSIVTSCEVGKDKTCPDIFLKTAEELGVSSDKCLVFEDTVSGITGAKKAGMKVIAVYDEYSLPFRDTIISLSDRYITDFNEIA